MNRFTGTIRETTNAFTGTRVYDRDDYYAKEAERLANAISQVESSGGKNLNGKSGEFGAFQFMPDTWTRISTATAGKALAQTPENERTVATQKIKQLLQGGKTPKEVALIWNTSLGGVEKPIVTKGVNKRGVKFDSEQYAYKVMSAYNGLAPEPFENTAAGIAVNTVSGLPKAAGDLLKSSAQKTAQGFKVIGGVIQDMAERSASPEVTLPDGSKLPRIDPTGLITAPAKIAAEVPNAVSKLIGALKSAQPAVKNLDAAYSAERGSRAGQAGAVMQQGAGQQGYFQALGKLKGELVQPDKRAFDMGENALAQTDLDDLFNQVQLHPHLDVYEKITAANGLQKLFDGQLPQQSQLSLMEDVFGKDLVLAIREKRPTWDKIKDNITSTLNLPRTLITSLDMSAVLRQGALLTATRPVAATRAFKEMARQTFSQKNFEAWLADVPNNPRYRSMKDSGLYIADPTRVSGGLAAREESFMTSLADRLPWVQASQRAYVSYLNKMRVDVFSDLAGKFEKDGIATPENLKSLASFVNHATGRGSLGMFERSAQGLNNIFFSPRLVAARLNVLNPAWYMKQTSPVRKEAIKTMLQFVGTGMTIVGLAKAAGAEVETDPRSTDFAKIKIGDTRWDIWGGFQQWIRAISQIASGQRKSAAGNVYDLDKNKFPFESRLDIAGRFVRTKVNPTVGLALELAEGQKMFGEELTLKGEFFENTVPLYLQDIGKVIDEVGVQGIFTAGVPGFFGVGIQHYEEKRPGGNRFSN